MEEKRELNASQYSQERDRKFRERIEGVARHRELSTIERKVELERSLEQAKKRKQSYEMERELELSSFDAYKKSKADLVIVNKVSFQHQLQRALVNQSLEYAARKTAAHRIKENFHTLQQAVKISRIMQKNEAFEKSQQDVLAEKSAWLTRHINSHIAKQLDAEKRKQAIEAFKQKQLETLDSTLQETASIVLQNKCDIDNSRKQYFHAKVQEHDLSILQKRRNADLMRVACSDTATKGVRTRRSATSEGYTPRELSEGESSGVGQPQVYCRADQAVSQVD